MKALIAIFIIVVVCMGGWKLVEYYGTMKEKEAGTESASAAAAISGDSLPGLPYQLESSLKQAHDNGPKAMKQWLETYKKSPLVKDPRLAWIELDYVVMVGPTDPVEAKRVFAEVKERTATDSPVYPRLQALAKTYQ